MSDLSEQILWRRNTLAYFETASVTNKQSLMTLAPKWIRRSKFFVFFSKSETFFIYFDSNLKGLLELLLSVVSQSQLSKGTIGHSRSCNDTLISLWLKSKQIQNISCFFFNEKRTKCRRFERWNIEEYSSCVLVIKPFFFLCLQSFRQKSFCVCASWNLTA